MNKKYWLVFTVFFLGILSGCSHITPNPPASTSTISSNTLIATSTVQAKTETPTPQPSKITFEVTFDSDENCIVTGPNEIPTGEYLFQLNNQSDRKVNITVTHLIDGHTYEDLFDLQDEYGEPFVIVYWMSQPYYFTKDHKVWHYTLDEAGEYAILVVQYVFEGKWICQPIQVVESE